MTPNRFRFRVHYVAGFIDPVIIARRTIIASSARQARRMAERANPDPAECRVKIYATLPARAHLSTR